MHYSEGFDCGFLVFDPESRLPQGCPFEICIDETFRSDFWQHSERDKHRCRVVLTSLFNMIDNNSGQADECSYLDIPSEITGCAESRPSNWIATGFLILSPVDDMIALHKCGIVVKGSCAQSLFGNESWHYEIPKEWRSMVAQFRKIHWITSWRLLELCYSRGPECPKWPDVGWRACRQGSKPCSAAALCRSERCCAYRIPNPHPQGAACARARAGRTCMGAPCRVWFHREFAWGPQSRPTWW